MAFFIICRKQRREERLSQHPSVQTDYSVDSDNSATPVNVNRQVCRLDETATTDTNDENNDDWPENWEKEWIAEGSNEPTSSLYRAGHVNHSFNSHTDLLQLDSSQDDAGNSASSHPNDDDNDNDACIEESLSDGVRDDNGRNDEYSHDKEYY